jgi:3-deoxy-D-manno-octulosonic acid kinase
MNAAAAGDEVLAPLAGGAMLYDASRLGQPEAEVFELERWRARGALEQVPGGRGSVAFVQASAGARWVLRHYRRGGLVARVLDDRYLWTGAEATRSFREWRLLRRLRQWSLPVPAPVAARYAKAGPVAYRADLLTEELPTRATLASALRAGPLPGESWRAVGRCIGGLHARGVHHADLNAHNLLLGADPEEVYVLDFDRGRIRARGAWEREVLARLQRSLRKVTADLPADRYGDEQWRLLLAGVG